MFKNKTNEQMALVKVRASPRFDEFLEFDVELSEIPIKDGRGKDVAVTWKMLDGFSGNQTFFTDANGLEMQERKLNYNPGF